MMQETTVTIKKTRQKLRKGSSTHNIFVWFRWQIVIHSLTSYKITGKWLITFTRRLRMSHDCPVSDLGKKCYCEWRRETQKPKNNKISKKGISKVISSVASHKKVSQYKKSRPEMTSRRKSCRISLKWDAWCGRFHFVVTPFIFQVILFVVVNGREGWLRTVCCFDYFRNDWKCIN